MSHQKPTEANCGTEELQHRLVQWLGVPDPSTNYREALKKRHPETGLWLVNGSRFNDWKSSQSSLMWLHGNGRYESLLVERHN